MTHPRTLKKALLAALLVAALALLLIPLLTMPASAATSGYYTYTVLAGKAMITDVNTSISGAVTIPSTLGGCPVTSIDYEAFDYCSKLTSITIPSSVTSIGSYAFRGCSSLTSVTFGENSKLTSIGSYAFDGCSSLASIKIPSLVTSIGNYAFYNCYSLTSVTISDRVKSIGGSAFYGCYKLVEVINRSNLTITKGSTENGYVAYYAKEVHSGATKIVNQDDYLFYAYNGVNYLLGYVGTDMVLTLPASYNGQNYEICRYAFYDCSSLTSISIPSSVTSIGYQAFYGCSSLTSVYIKDLAAWCEISFDGSYANPLYYAKNLYLNGELVTNLEIPSSVTSIGSSAFYNCKSLTSITIPSSVTSIGSSAFYGCSSLQSITLPFVGASLNGTSDMHFGYIFGASSYSYNGNYVPSALKTVVITGGESIGSSAFYNCKSLTSITLPSSVTSIGYQAFDGCSSLTSIEIPSSVTSIGSSAFYNCKSLTSITIPSSVTSIGSSAFEDCTSLTSITIPSSVTSIGYQAFYDCSSLTSVYIKDLAAWCGISFDGSYANPLCYAKNLYLNGELVTNLEIPSSVTSIGSYAFRGCSSLTSIEIPSSVTSIGSSAFYGCSSLQSITLPFVGASLNGTENTHFGYIFGASSYSNNGDCVPSSLKTVVITGGKSIGKDAFKYCSSLTSITIPSSVTSIGSYAFWDCSSLTSITIPSSVTSIGYQAFYRCSSLTSVYIKDLAAWCRIYFDRSFANPFCYAKNLYLNGELVTNLEIPSSVTRIGNYAFDGCSSLTSITIPSSVTSIGDSAFAYCTSLTSITIPSSVTRIGNYAFYGCSSLQSITLPFVGASLNGTENTHFGYIFGASSYSYNGDYVPSSLKTVVITGGKSIGSSAFYGCSSLQSITLPFVGASLNGTSDTHFGYIFGASSYSSNNSYVPSSLKTVVITGGKSIRQDAFYNCSSLESITIPSSVTSIGSSAFYNCKSLTGITIPSSVTSIGLYAFYNCSSLTSVTIPSSVTSIGSSAFRGCSSLTSIEIPSSVTSIGDDAFQGCSSLTSITVNSGNKVYHSAGNCLIETASKTLIAGCKNSVIPTDGSVTSIGDYAFKGCSSLTSITIPSFVTSIGSSAFSGCTSLSSVTIPDSVTSIGSYVFYGCTSLSSVTIPDSVTSIGSSAFEGCSSLTSIEIPSTVTSIGSSAFSGCSSLESITLPFVGASLNGTSNMHFGYIFGAFFSDDNNSYVPSSLKTVVITGGRSIGNYAFSGCSSLASITIPSSVTSIGSSAFSGCSSLTSVSFGENSQLTSIGNYAFSGCSSLASIEIPSSVTSIGDDAFRGCSSLESITLPFVGASLSGTSNTHFGYIFGASSYSYNDNYVPSALKKVVITGGESIGSSAFYNCKSLTSITIPSSVTSIGYQAFYGCSSLTSIEIPSSVTTIGNYAFADCSSLTSITLPSSVTSIGSSAFEDCTSLTSITIPSSVTSIGSSAFYGCSSLASVSFGENSQLTSIGSSAFYNCKSLTTISIPSSVTSIGSSAFYGCSSLQSITLPFVGASLNGTSNTHFGYFFGASSYSYNGNYVPSALKTVVITGGESIGSSAFYNCKSLTSITIPSSVTSIGSSAFYNCKSLTSITLPSSVTSIGSSAFEDCTSLTSITIPSSVTSIGSSAFEDCTSLTSITLPSSVTSIGSSAFYNCKSLTSITIPSSVTSIGGGAFSGCSSLTSITIPSSVTTIGNYAFADCSSLTSITLPSSVTSIGSSAFSGCSSLTSIEIPASVRTLGDSAFYGCSSLKSVNFAANSQMTKIGSSVFYDCSSLVRIEVPGGVNAIGSQAFYGCSSLESITLPFVGATLNGTSNTHFGYIFGASTYSNNAKCIPAALKSVLITGGSSIFDYAFCDCATLESVSLPSSVTSVGEYAFRYCTALKAIDLPVSVKSIGAFAFYNCPELKSVYYGGTKDKWNEVSIKNGNDALWNATIVYPCSNHVWDEGRITSEAGCEVEGVKTYTCTICGETKKEAVPELGHNGVSHAAQAPTCTEVGWDAYVTCSRCGYSTYQAKPTLGHDEITHEAKAPTCTESGWDAYVTCSRCDYTTYQAKSALGHDEIANEAKVPTCTEIGWDAYVTCSRCDYSSYQAKLALGHDYNCVEEGDWGIYTCTRCGDSFTEVLLSEVALKTEAFETAWGMTFESRVLAGEAITAGTRFRLFYDGEIATLLSLTASDKLTVWEEDGVLTIKANADIAAEDELLILSFETSLYLTAGEHTLLTTDGEGSEFAPLVIYELGDVNLDGKVNARDVTMIKQYVVKMVELSDVQKVYANVYVDYDADGAPAINSRDSMLIQQFIVKMDVTLGDRVEITFSYEDAPAEALPEGDEPTEKCYSVKAEAAFDRVPALAEGYVWSVDKVELILPDFSAILEDKTYYVMKKEGQPV